MLLTAANWLMELSLFLLIEFVGKIAPVVDGLTTLHRPVLGLQKDAKIILLLINLILNVSSLCNVLDLLTLSLAIV